MLENVYGGIDPSSSASKPSGCTVLSQDGMLLNHTLAHADAEIIHFFQPYDLSAIAIDAPKGLPLDMGLCCLEKNPSCPCEVSESRKCERELMRLGISLYPVNKNAFAKAWIRRGLLLFLRFLGMGIDAYEVYPSGSKRMIFPTITFPKPKSGRRAREMLQDHLRPLIPQIPQNEREVLSDHTLDAILGAYTVFLFRERDQGQLYGDPREGQILLPVKVLKTIESTYRIES